MKLKFSSWSLTPYLMVVALISLQACGGGSSTPAPTDAYPTGYYDNSGTATIDDNGTDTGVATAIDDLQAMINGDRFMMISDAEGLFYDGTITSISINDFAANVSVYKHGQPIASSNAIITGTITEKSKITGTLTGTGAGNGSFTLQYALSNNQEADLSRIQLPDLTSFLWESILSDTGADKTGFQVGSTGSIMTPDVATDGFFIGCEIGSGSFTPINGTSLYTVIMNVTKCTNIADLTYEGLAASWTASAVADDRLVIGATDSNKTYSINGDFKY